MREYQRDVGAIDANPNGLRTGLEDNYVDYIADIFKQLKANNVELPAYHSLQNALDANLAEGCPLPKDQWISLAQKLRQQLDDDGIGEIQLMGPDSISYSGNERFLTKTSRSAPPPGPDWLG